MCSVTIFIIVDGFGFSANLAATYGAMFGYMLLMTHFLEKNDFIFVEELSYIRVLDASSEYGLQIQEGLMNNFYILVSDHILTPV